MVNNEYFCELLVSIQNIIKSIPDIHKQNKNFYFSIEDLTSKLQSLDGGLGKENFGDFKSYFSNLETRIGYALNTSSPHFKGIAAVGKSHLNPKNPSLFIPTNYRPTISIPTENSSVHHYVNRPDSSGQNSNSQHPPSSNRLRPISPGNFRPQFVSTQGNLPQQTVGQNNNLARPSGSGYGGVY